MDEAGLEMPRGGFAKSWDRLKRSWTKLVIRQLSAHRFLGGTGGYGLQLKSSEIIRSGLAASQLRGADRRVDSRLEGIRTRGREIRRQYRNHLFDENFDPMGVHRGRYCRACTNADESRIPVDARQAIRIIRKVGVETGIEYQLA